MMDEEICTRCREEMPPAEAVPLRIGIHGWMEQLCKRCMEDFKDWLEGNRKL